MIHRAILIKNKSTNSVTIMSMELMTQGKIIHPEQNRDLKLCEYPK